MGTHQNACPQNVRRGEARRGCAAYLAYVPDLDGALAGARREERPRRVPSHRRHRAVGRLHTRAGLCSVKLPPTPPPEHPLMCTTCTNTMALGLPVNTPMHTLNEATQTFACQSQCRSWPLRDAVIRMLSSGDSERHVSSSPSCPYRNKGTPVNDSPMDPLFTTDSPTTYPF
jgi:hypothetical protein